MNAITHAFKQSNVPLPPLNKRVWLWLNDHPGKTSKEVALAIGAKRGDVSSTLGNMAKRAMVAASKGPGRPGQRTAQTYYHTSLHTFELLPLPTSKPTPTVERPMPAAVMTSPIPKPVLYALEGFTLRDLRAIRDALNNLFEHV